MTTRISILRSLGLLLGAAGLSCCPVWARQPAHRQRRDAAATHAAAPARRTAPVTGSVLVRRLQAAFRRPPFTHDRIQVRVQGATIHLTGAVVLAEDRGLATREARRVAHAAHWRNYRVVNTLHVR